MQYRFAEFVLDTDTESVSGPDGPLVLRRRTFLLLRVLVEQAPALVTRDQILDEVWGHDALSANVLPQAISEVRQALGDNANAPRLIQTRHRRGYRLMVPVERVIVADAGVVAADVALAAMSRVEPARQDSPDPMATARARAASAGARWRGPALALAAVLLVLVAVLFARQRGADEASASVRPVLALAITAPGNVPEWLSGAGTELLAVAMAGDDRMQLLRGDGRSGPEGTGDARWQTWMREILGADYALTGVWRASENALELNYSLVRLDDGRVQFSGSSSDSDLAALCRDVASRLRRQLRLIDPQQGWLAELPRAPAARESYYRGLAALSAAQAGAAIAALEQASADPAAGNRVRLALASAYRMGGRLTEARAQFTQLLVREDSFAVGERLRLEAEAALVDARPADAAASLRALHRLMPEDGDVALALVDAQIRARQRDQAATTLASLEKLASGSSNDPRWHLAKSRLASLQHAPEAAVAAAEQALALAERFGRDELATQAHLELAQVARARGDLGAARTRLQTLLDGEVTDLWRAEAEVQLGSLLRDIGDFDAADKHLQKALEFFVERGDRAGELRARIERHVIESERGHSEQAYAELIALEPAVVALGDALLLTRYFNTLGVQAVRNNQIDDASMYLQRAASEARRAQQPALEAGAYGNLGMALARARRSGEAEAVWEQALEVFRDSGDRLGAATTLGNLATVAGMDPARQARARDLGTEALRLFRELQANQHVARTAFNLGLVSEREGDLGGARALFEEALAAYRLGSAGDPVLNVAAALVRVRLAAAELEGARDVLASIHDHEGSVANPLARAHVLAARGNLARLAGEPAQARVLFDQALGLRKDDRGGWALVSELDLLALDLHGTQSVTQVRAAAERIADRADRTKDVRTALRARLLEAEALIRMQRGADALALLDRNRQVLATQPDAALSFELERLRILAAGDAAESRRARLRGLADEAERDGFRTFALRCRIDADPEAGEPRSQARALGLLGLDLP